MPKGRTKSVDAARFAMPPSSDVPRSVLDVPSQHKTTFRAGMLVPMYLAEILPGDMWNVKCDAVCRMAPALVPVMDNLHLEWFWFFCPNRLLWSNWERFMGAQTNPTDTTVFLTPQITLTDVHFAGQNNVYDFFGLTMNKNPSGSLSVQSLPLRMYTRVWNEWFRDQHLQDPAYSPDGDGPDDPTQYFMLNRGKRHDYFTTCRPWPQAYGNAPGLVLGQEVGLGGGMTVPSRYNGAVGAPVSGLGVSAASNPAGGQTTQRESGGRTITYPEYYAGSSVTYQLRADPTGGTYHPDLRVMINDLRTASAVQRLLEKNARGGTRYAELVWEHFKVRSPDARLQRPEFLGSSRSVMQMTAIAQTSNTPTTPAGATVLGELAGVGTIITYGAGFSQSFTEHGWILGMCCVRADLSYQHGVERHWYRRTRWDYFWPELEGLGEQAVLGRELFCWGDGSAGDETVFGYQERFSEYKYKPSQISGKFRSTTVGEPLDMWHFTPKYTSRPLLNPAFIVENPPVDRALQVSTQTGEQFLIDARFSTRRVRPMRVHSVPGVGGRL